jgi:hypothetical protein
MSEFDLKIRHKNNPFLENMLVPVRNKKVKLSRLGKDDNVLMNHETGEVSGTHLTTYKRVDSDQFIKLFTANVGMTFELTAAGIKTFSVLLFCVQKSAISKDEVDLDSYTLDDFMQQNKNKKPPLKLSSATFKRGLNELEKAQIVAKTVRQGRYYINPNFVFNGDRIAFTTLIERDKSEQLSLSKGL